MRPVERLSKEFGRILKERRESAIPKLTQQDLADKVGLKRTSVTNIEKGNQQVSLAMLYKFAGALNISPADLLPDQQFAVDDLSDLLMSKIDNLPLSEKTKQILLAIPKTN